VCGSGLSDTSWDATSGLASWELRTVWNLFGLHCLSLSLSTNPIAQMVSICNHHRTVISPQSSPSSGITTVFLSSPSPSEHRRATRHAFTVEFGIRSPALRRQMPPAGHVRIKKKLKHRSLQVHLLFRKSFRAPARPTFRIQHCSALGACTYACNSNKQIPNSSSRCVLHAVHQFIYSHDSSVSWRSWEVCRPPDSSDLPRSRLSAASDERGEVSSRSHPRVTHMWSLHSLAPRVLPHPASH
jgi:hypothetical protein